MPAFKDLLLAQKKQQEENRRLCGRSYDKQYLDYICVDEMGRLISPHYLTSAFPKLLEAYYQTQLEAYPDLLDVKQVMELTGYGRTAIHHWLSSGKLKSFLCGNKRRIPKKFLLAFLLSETYSEISRKSKKHLTVLRKFGRR